MKKGVHVNGSWEHPADVTTSCAYFKFNMMEWEKYFGSFDPDKKIKVKQCRNDGTELWMGNVDVFNASATYPPHGIESHGPYQSPACGQWVANDYVVKHDKSCVR